jgi:hypothetical protein
LKKIYLLASFILLLAACKNKHGNSLSFLRQLWVEGDSIFIPAVVLSDSGWTSLSGGNTIRNWHTYGRKTAGAAWNIDSGSIHLNAGAKNGYQTLGGGDLVSNDTFSNFDLKLEWKIVRKANSGIMIFVQEDTRRYKETWNTGPEIQVCDMDSNEDAHSFKHEAGDLYDLIPSRTMAAKPAMEWNQVEIVSNNQRLDLYLNEVHIISSGLWNETWKKLLASSKFKDMPGFRFFIQVIWLLQDHGGSMVSGISG